MARIPGRNLTIKIFALILATVLWMYVMNEQNPPIEASFTVPIEMRNLSAGLMLIDAPENVRIKVKGPRSVVAGVSAKDIQCYIDLKDLKEGRHSLKVNTVVPPILELVEVNPDKANVRLDVSVARQIPIELRIKGTAANGATVAKTSINPDTVRIEGPKGQLDLVDKVIALFDITGKDADMTVQVPLLAVNKEGQEVEGITLIPDRADIFISFLRQEAKKTVNVKAIVEGSLPQGLTLKKITVVPDKVEITATKEIADRISGLNTQSLNLAEIDKDVTRQLKLQLPEGVSAVPNAVSITINVEGTPR